MIIIEYSPLFGKVLLLLRVVLTSSDVYIGKMSQVIACGLDYWMTQSSAPPLLSRSDAALHRQKEPQKLHLQMYVHLVMLDLEEQFF